MPLKYHHTAQSAGETFSIELIQTNPQTGEPAHTVEEMDALMSQALQVMDKRKYEMNQRVLTAYGLIDMLSDSEKYKFKQLLQVLSGDMTPAYLQHLWQSAQEETADLETARQQHTIVVAEKLEQLERLEQMTEEEVSAYKQQVADEFNKLMMHTAGTCHDCGRTDGQHESYCCVKVVQ